MIYFNKEINTLLANLENGTCVIPDTEIIGLVETYDKSLQTNCDTAAQYLFSLVSAICVFRKSVRDILLFIAIEPLYFLGIDTPKGVLDWLALTLKQEKEKKHTFFTNIGKKWLQNELPRETGLMQLIFFKLKAMTYIQNIAGNITWSGDGDNVILYDKEKGLLTFTDYTDLHHYLVEQYQKKLTGFTKKQDDRECLYKDSSYFIHRELHTHRYKQIFRRLGWILPENG